MSKNIVVVGGGVIGLCTAYYLVKDGHRVTVLDKGSMDAGASYVNAGYLTPSHIVPLAAPGMISAGLRYMFNSASPFYMKPRLNKDFLQWAWAFKKSATAAKVAKAMPLIRDINLLSRDLYDDLKTSGDLGAFHYERKGLLMLFQTHKEGDHEIAVAAKGKELGLPSEILGPEAIKALEPNIGIDAIGAVHYLCDGHTTPTDFMQRLLVFLQKSGVTIHKQQEVKGFTVTNNKVISVNTNKATYAADEVVFAAGSWSAALAKQLKVKLPIQAGKGYRIDVAKPTGISMPALLLEAKMAVTPMDGYTRFAGTMEFSGVNNHIRKERVAAIAKGASRFYQGLQISDQDQQQAQCGLRPVSPDGLPYIGRSVKIQNMVFATAHAMMGWSLGPATGKLVSQLIAQKQPSLSLEAYHPDRRF